MRVLAKYYSCLLIAVIGYNIQKQIQMYLNLEPIETQLKYSQACIQG